MIDDLEFDEMTSNYDLCHSFLVNVVLGNDVILTSEFLADKDHSIHLKACDFKFKENEKNLVIEIKSKETDQIKKDLMDAGEKTEEDWIIKKSIDYCDDLENWSKNID